MGETLAHRKARRGALKGGGNADPVRQYLSEIGRVALLTREDEVALAKRVQAGMVARGLLAELDTPESCRWAGDHAVAGLTAIDSDGHEAFDHLCSANLRLVVSIAKRYLDAACHFSIWSKKATWG